MVKNICKEINVIAIYKVIKSLETNWGLEWVKWVNIEIINSYRSPAIK